MSELEQLERERDDALLRAEKAEANARLWEAIAVRASADIVLLRQRIATYAKSKARTV